MITDFFSKLGIGCILYSILLGIYLIIGGLIFSFIWNLVMPDIFGLPDINYFQAILILLISKMLCGQINVTNNNK